MFLRGVVNGDFEQALAAVHRSATISEGEAVAVPEAIEPAWTAKRLEEALEAYNAGHEFLCFDPNARNARHTYVVPSEDHRHWRVQQMLVDPEGHNDWVAEFEVDLPQSRAIGEPILRLTRMGPLA
jgi:hypothetical protein